MNMSFKNLKSASFYIIPLLYLFSDGVQMYQSTSTKLNCCPNISHMELLKPQRKELRQVILKLLETFTVSATPILYILT